MQLFLNIVIAMLLKKYFHILFLVGIITLKILSVPLHMYFNHNGSDDHQDTCELCEHAIQNQDLDTYKAVVLHTVALFNKDSYSQEKNYYKSVYKKSLLTTIRFGRPPPSLV